MKKIDPTPIIWCATTILGCILALCLQNVYAHSNAIPLAAAIIGVAVAFTLSECDRREGAEITIPIVICTLFIASVVIAFGCFEIFDHNIEAERRMWIDIGLLILLPFMGVCYDGDSFIKSNY